MTWPLRLLGPEDERTQNYIFVEPKIVPITLTMFYLYFVLKLGPRLMEKVKAFQLNKVLMIYNWMQITLNAWVFVESMKVASHMNPLCEPIDKSLTPKGLYPAKLFHYYYGLKLLDLMDTVFFVLRKKNNQVTVLHLYHHAAMVWTAWIGTRIFPGGQGFFLIPINTFIHVIMYFYYFVTSQSSTFGNTLWWKKYLTQLQIVQHVMLIVILTTPFFYPECFPVEASCLFVPSASVTFTLFINFYIKNYIKEPKKEKNVNDN